MKNRAVVILAGREYSILSEDGEKYIHAVAGSVDGEIQAVLADGRLALTDAALLTALNFADREQKALDSADYLRSQVKTYLDEAQKLKSELSEARRELSRLKKQGLS